MSKSDTTSSQEQETRNTSRFFSFSFFIRTLSSCLSIQGEMHMSYQTAIPPRASRTRRPKTPLTDTQDYEDAFEDENLPGMPTITRCYQTTPIPAAQTTNSLPTPTKWNWQKIKYKGLQITLGVLLVGLVVDGFGYPVWNTASTHWHYGDYPTTHVIANFGHGGTSDLFAFTSGNEVEVIEEVHGKANVYAVKLGTVARRVVKLEMVDANGDGKLDIILSIDGVAQHPCLLNTGNGFEWSVSR